MTAREAGSPPRIWALLGARIGDNDQIIALAQALGLPFETKQLHYNGFRHLGPRILGRSLVSLTRHSRALLLGGPPPNVTISSGHRSVAVVRALKARSRNEMRTIHIGFPRISPRHFDLVIATPQYPIADHPNLLLIPVALTPVATQNSDPDPQESLAALPLPRRLFIIGGPTLYWNLDRSALNRTLDRLLGEALEQGGGSVLVATSARTPESVHHAITKTLNNSVVPTILVKPKSSPRYSSLLAAATSIHVTADSVSMVSDAIWADKEMAIVPIRKSALGSIAFGLNDWARPGRPLYPQDLRLFWKALSKIGVTENLARPKASMRQEMQRVLERVRKALRQS